ncbi:DNA-formamidopyrimidine glycosylase [Eubacteriaceae bacterium ES2]|nr:DNA-formamidopyrimidine glycosylase [Eubacteriaceae bacterium ES2]
MPELPEVETVRQTLRNFIIGKKIADVQIHYDKIVEDDSNEFIKTLTGQTIRDIDRIGKYLIFILDSTAFISHLRMEGKYNLTDSSKPLGKHEHISFIFTDQTQLRYQDTRKFGRLQLVDKTHYHQQLPLSKLGPEPWDADVQQIYQRLHKSRLAIKSLLLDQTIIAGIGNIYANEICYRMQIDPATPGNRLSRKRTAELIKTASQILKEAIEQGGTTIHSFDANGVSGLFQVSLQVHLQKNCPRCQKAITKEMIGGRGTYYCKNCQKKRG